MKVQLDTTNKTIKLEQSIKLSELVKNLEKLLPKGEWKEFTLETNTVINNWHNPINVTPRWRYYYWGQPWYNTMTTTCQNIASTSLNAKGDASDLVTLKSGTYNIEM